MNHEAALQHPAALADARSRSSAALEILAVAGLMTLAAWVRIQTPFTPVAFTMQTLVVLVSPFLVGWRRATAGMLLYVSVGMFGAPILAHFGVSFGYLAAFCFAPAIVAAFRRPLPGMLAAMALIYVMGAGWLMFWTGVSLQAAVLAGVAPFLAGDAVKLVAAAAAARALQR
jgi:biotin transport system substrate-specific component